MASRIMFNRRDSALYDQRDEPRHKVECVRATANGEAETPFVATLADISTFGCRLTGVVDLEEGRRIWVRLPNSPPITAQVAWADKGAAGCRFDTPISQSLMRSLLTGAVSVPS